MIILKMGVYFITICTKNKEKIFWKTFVGASNARPQEYKLSEYGIVAEEGIKNIPKFYDVKIDSYVVMPNHIHILLTIENNGRAMHAPASISKIIQQYKGFVTKKLGFSPGQKLFMII